MKPSKRIKLRQSQADIEDKIRRLADSDKFLEDDEQAVELMTKLRTELRDVKYEQKDSEAQLEERYSAMIDGTFDERFGKKEEDDVEDLE